MQLALFDFGRPIDVTNGILVGMFFFCMSVPLAIFTGIVAARMLAFTNALTEAGGTLATVPARIHDAGDLYTAHRSLTTMFAKARFTLAELDQDRATTALGVIEKEVKAFYRARLIARMTHDERKAHALDQDPLFTPERWRTLVDEALAGTKPEYLAFAGRIDHLRPQYFRLFYFPIGAVIVQWISDRYAPRRSDCGDCCENCKRVV